MPAATAIAAIERRSGLAPAFEARLEDGTVVEVVSMGSGHSIACRFLKDHSPLTSFDILTHGNDPYFWPNHADRTFMKKKKKPTPKAKPRKVKNKHPGVGERSRQR